jgi:uncharacterized protein (TIGR02145 family)
LGENQPLPSNIRINNTSLESVVASIYDNTPYNPAIDIQGVVDDSTNAINVNVAYTVTDSATTLPAYSTTFTIDAANTQDNQSGIVATFSWYEQLNLAVGSGTFNATITTSSTYNIKKLDMEDDIAGIEVATFSYPTDNSGTRGTAILKVIAGIPDRMFGIADNSGDTNTHRFVYLPVTNPTTGQTWLNNNLGAEYADVTSDNFNPAQQATASNDHKAYGSLFQWGRKADGHELMDWTNGSKRAGKAGRTTKNNNAPTDTLFITESDSPSDWRVNKDDTLWANEASANNVCPVGYRLPTAGAVGKNAEWEVEVDSWYTDRTHHQTTSVHALKSTLKLPMSGYRYNRDAANYFRGSRGYYWSANVRGTDGRTLSFDSTSISPHDFYHRAYGFGVRCIKD